MISFVVSLTISVTTGFILKVLVVGGLGVSEAAVDSGSAGLRLGGSGGLAAFKLRGGAWDERSLNY